MPNKIIEEKVDEFKKSYKGVLPEVIIESGAIWYRNALQEVYEAGYKEGARRGCRFCFSTDNQNQRL